MLLKKTEIILITSIISIYLLLALMLINNIFDEGITVYLLKVMLILMFVIVVNFSIKKYGLYSSISLLLYTFFLFCLSRFFLDILGLASINSSDKYVFYTISRSTIFVVITSYLVFLIVLLTCMLFFNNDKTTMKLKNNLFLEKYSGLILILTFPFVGIILANDIINVLKNGYFSLYSNNTNFKMLSAFWYVFYFTIPVYLSSLPQRRSKTFLYTIIIIVIVLDSLKGSRGELFRPLLFIVWFMSLNGRKLDFKKALVFVLATPIISNIFVYFREGGAFFTDFFKSLVVFLYSQGVTTVLFANFIDYRESVVNDTRWYFLSGLVEPVRRYITQRSAYNAGRSEDFAEISLSLDHKLMSTLNLSLYQDGVGYGSNLVTEFYAFSGYLGIIILTILLSIIIFYFEKNARINRVILVVSFFWVQNLLWAPRGTLIPNPIFIGISLLIYFSIILFQKNNLIGKT